MLTLRKAIYSESDLRFLAKLLDNGLDSTCISEEFYDPSDCATCEHRHICRAINNLANYAIKKADEKRNERK